MDINEPLDQEIEVPVRPGDEVAMDVQESIAAVVACPVVPNIMAQDEPIGVALGEPNIDDYNGPSGIARGASNIVEVRGPNDIVLGVPIRVAQCGLIVVAPGVPNIVAPESPNGQNADAMQAPPAPAQMACPFLNCAQGFDNTRQLLVHAFNNHQPIQYPCPVADCHQSFRSINGLYRHLDQVRVAMELEQDAERRARMHQLYAGENVCIKCNQAISNGPISLRQLDRICAHKQVHGECLKQNCRVADGGSYLDILVHNTYAHGPPMIQLVAAVAAAAELAAAADREGAGNDPGFAAPPDPNEPAPAVVPRQGPSGARPPGHRPNNPSPSFSASGDSGYEGSPRGNRPPNPNNSRAGEPPAKRQREQKKE